MTLVLVIVWFITLIMLVNEIFCVCLQSSPLVSNLISAQEATKKPTDRIILSHRTKHETVLSLS